MPGETQQKKCKATLNGMLNNKTKKKNSLIEILIRQVELKIIYTKHL